MLEIRIRQSLDDPTVEVDGQVPTLGVDGGFDILVLKNLSQNR